MRHSWEAGSGENRDVASCSPKTSWGSAALLVERVKPQRIQSFAWDLALLRLGFARVGSWRDHTFAASATSGG